MPINFESVFSIHDDAMILRSRRSSILASNIANTDTPNYKARDINFKAILQMQARQQSDRLALTGTHDAHIKGTASSLDQTLQYRNPLHASLDGNTVDSHVEQARFAENALQFQTSFTLLNGRIQGLIKAIKGE